MALKHFKGRVPTAAGTEWTCPTCQGKQTGPLEQGCVLCGAGVPTAAIQDRPPVGRPFAEADPFDAWLKTTDVRSYADDLPGLRAAFEAGVKWGQQMTKTTAPMDTALPVEGVGGPVNPEAVTPPSSGQYLIVASDADPMDARRLTETEAITVLAALAFYLENQLNYGDVPGQLTATQVSEMILQLTPAEEEVSA